MKSVKAQVWKNHMDWSSFNHFRHAPPGFDFAFLEESAAKLIFIITPQMPSMQVYWLVAGVIRDQMVGRDRILGQN